MSIRRSPCVTALAIVITLGAFALAGPATGAVTVVKTPARSPAPGLATKSLSGYAVVSSTYSSPAHAEAHGTVDCPSGTLPLGGGAYFASSSLHAAINSSYPQVGGWVADVNNGSSSASTFTVYDVCAAKPTDYLRVASKSMLAAPDGEEGEFVASCPKGKPIGGGLYSSSDSLQVNVMDSWPGPPDFAPGQGWVLNVTNDSNAGEYMRAYAVCGTVPKYHVVYGPATPHPTGVQVGATALCGSGVPVGGGAYNTNFSEPLTLNSTYPVAGGWRSYGNNLSGLASTFWPYVVCSG